jgi:hypothetical protein
MSKGFLYVGKDTYVACVNERVVRSQEFEDTSLLFIARLKKERKQALREFEGSASVLVEVRIPVAERSDLRLDLGNTGFVFALFDLKDFFID